MRAIPVRILVAAPPTFLESEVRVALSVASAVLVAGAALAFGIGLPWGSAGRLVDVLAIGGGLLHLVGCRKFSNENGSTPWGLWFAGLGLIWLALAWDPASSLKTWDQVPALMGYAVLIAWGVRTCWAMCQKKAYLSACGGGLYWTAHVWLLISNSKVHFAGSGILESWIV